MDDINITLSKEDAITLARILDDFRYFLGAVKNAEETYLSSDVLNAVDSLRTNIDIALKE